MKRYVLLTALLAMLVSVPAFAQEHFEGAATPEEKMEHGIHMRNMQLDLEQREAEMGFNQKMRELELKKQYTKLQRQQKPQKHPACVAHCHKGRIIPFVIVCFIVHVLVAVWVYQDIRRRNSGSGIWIVVALLTGLLGTLVYAVVRIGDTPQPKS